jgi:hypothetical protein
MQGGGMGTDGILSYDRKSGQIIVKDVGGRPEDVTFGVTGNAKLFFDGVVKQTGKHEFEAFVQFADRPDSGVAIKQMTINYKGKNYAFLPQHGEVGSVYQMRGNGFIVKREEMTASEVQKLFVKTVQPLKTVQPVKPVVQDTLKH